MCGIAGVLNLKKPGSISLDLIKRMVASLYHRGPDESGIYLDNWIGLGHARLSIIDLSGGSQPIHNEDETLWIVYNGEVFNYPELRDDLLKKGHHFYTSTDTEVILHLYEEEGTSCLNHLNGQFALAIWDLREKELFLARDRVGIRPLYYTVQDNSIIFASEIKSIFTAEKVPRAIDPTAMDQIFTFWTTLPGRTIFKGINELPSGHFLKSSHNQTIVTKYWNIPFYPSEEQLNWTSDKISTTIQELLKDAVRIRLRADVPVGCYLSGGLDSSGITALVIKNFNNEVSTFGIRFEEEAFDEGEHQELMVSLLNANHRAITATNEKIGSSFPYVIWHCEKPILRTAPVPLFLLSQLVHQNGLKVVITGEGADEIFGGYNIFRETKVRRFWAKRPESRLRSLLIGKLYPYIFDNPRLERMLKTFFAQGLDTTDNPFFSHLIRWNNTSKIKTFFSSDLRAAIDPDCSYEELRQILPESYGKWDYLCKAQYLEMVTFLSNYLLSSQGDRVAMAHSLEIRLPYLDYRIIDFMGRVPSKLKIMGLNEKHILKKSFCGILPKDIINRPKHPYRAPIKQSLLNEKTSEYVKDMFSDASLKDAGLFDIPRVRMLFKKLQSVDSPGEVDSMALVGILSTQLVVEQFIKNFREMAANETHRSKSMTIYNRKTLQS
jgi:asparagine synthase (glutamine-hydrolysing)